MKVGTNLALLRSNRGYTLRELGEKTGINFSELSKMERGLMIPTDDQLLELCRVLKSTADMIYPSDELRRVLAE